MGITQKSLTVSVLACIHAVDKLVVGNRLAQRALIQPPKLYDVGKDHESIKGCLDRLAVIKKFVAGQIKLSLPLYERGRG